MGNCVFRGFAQSSADHVIKVVTANGGVMELHSPITAECITNSFPGHGIFHSRDFLSVHPLLHSDELHPGELYHLLPLAARRSRRTSSAPAVPYRVSFDSNGGAWRRVVEPADGGVWKVKLVISPEQLTEILSTETRTEALIESVRTVAKCGSGLASSAASSDQWSVASSLQGAEKVA